MRPLDICFYETAECSFSAASSREKCRVQTRVQREECTQLCKSLPSCRAQLVRPGASPQGGFCFIAGLARACKLQENIYKIGGCLMLKDRANMDLKEQPGTRRHAGAEPAGGRSPAGGGLARATAHLHQHRGCSYIRPSTVSGPSLAAISIQMIHLE